MCDFLYLNKAVFKKRNERRKGKTNRRMCGHSVCCWSWRPAAPPDATTVSALEAEKGWEPGAQQGACAWCGQASGHGPAGCSSSQAHQGSLGPDHRHRVDLRGAAWPCPRSPHPTAPVTRGGQVTIHLGGRSLAWPILAFWPLLSNHCPASGLSISLPHGQDSHPLQAPLPPGPATTCCQDPRLRASLGIWL